MNGGEIIAKILVKHDVKYLFTLCGGHISPIFVAAEKSGIRVIDTRHEATAVFAADAVSRLSGVPGVATVTAGPGVTNTVTAVKNAALAQSPLILLGGAAATILKGRGSLQDIDQLSIMKSVCKWSMTITRVRDIVPVLEMAFRKCQEGVPGPVFVECPIDILYDEDLVKSWYNVKSRDTNPTDLKTRFLAWYVNRHVHKIFDGAGNMDFDRPVTKPTFSKHTTGDITRAVQMLKTASKPLFVIGSGAMMQADKVHQLAQALDRLGIPVYLSGMARGLLGKNHPLQLRHHRKDAIKDADLIILAGVPNDFRLDYGNHIGRRPFISINRSKEDLFKNKKPTLAFLADPMDFVIDLSGAYQFSPDEWIGHLKQRDMSREDHITEKAAQTHNGGINPLALFRHLEENLGNDTILVADGGDFVASASYTLHPRGPLSWLDPGVYGTLGVGAGFAIGAKLVHPEKDVWIIYGDGSAGYSLMEYDTYQRLGLSINALIGNDACWGQIARDQVELLHSDCAMNLAYSDYQMIAMAFGGDGIRVDNLDDFKTAVQKAKASSMNKIPYIINAILAKSDFRKGSISV